MAMSVRGSTARAVVDALSEAVEDLDRQPARVGLCLQHRGHRPDNVPVLARKPGALRNGVPFRNWLLPPALTTVRRKLKATDDGLSAVEATCREAFDNGVHSVPVIINILARRREPAPPHSYSPQPAVHDPRVRGRLRTAHDSLRRTSQHGAHSSP